MHEELFLPTNRLIFFMLLAFGLSAIAARGLAGIATHVGLMDMPGGRKQHAAPVPVIGGIAMFFGLAAAVLGSGLVVGPTLALIAALFMTSWAGVYVSHLGDLLGFGPVNLYHWAIPFSVVCALGVINAINMVDGLDGSAGGIALVATLWLALAAYLQRLSTQTMLLLMLASAIAGFLMWNLRVPGRAHARVFMGDAGAMMLGLALCWFTIDVTQGERRIMPPIACVWILAVPLLDMARVMFLRLLRRTDMFDGDREHLHHYLIARGYSVSRTVAILMAASAVTGAIGIGAWQLGVPDWVMFYLFAALAASVLRAAYTRARG